MLRTLASVALASTLAACSGSPGSSIDGPATLAAPSPSSPEPQPPTGEGDGSADGGGSVPLEQDAGSDASRADASSADAGDSGPDAGDPPPPPPPPAYGVRFDGTAGQRLLVDMPNVSNMATATFEGWLRLDQATANGLLFNTPQPYCAVGTTGPNAGKLECCASQDGSGCVHSSGPFSVGVFHHVAMVIDSGVIELYLDGVLQASGATGYAAFEAYANYPFPEALNRLSFGSTASANPSSVTTVDEFRVSLSRRYNGSFTPAKHLPTDGNPTLLIDEGAGPDVNAGAGKLLGGASWVTVSR